MMNIRLQPVRKERTFFKILYSGLGQYVRNGVDVGEMQEKFFAGIPRPMILKAFEQRFHRIDPITPHIPLLTAHEHFLILHCRFGKERPELQEGGFHVANHIATKNDGLLRQCQIQRRAGDMMDKEQRYTDFQNPHSTRLALNSRSLHPIQHFRYFAVKDLEIEWGFVGP